MKKMIALVLALVMTLSLLPMNVWATDGGGGEGGGTPNSVGSPSDISSPSDQPSDDPSQGLCGDVDTFIATFLKDTNGDWDITATNPKLDSLENLVAFIENIYNFNDEQMNALYQTLDSAGQRGNFNALQDAGNFVYQKMYYGEDGKFLDDYYTAYNAAVGEEKDAFFSWIIRSVEGWNWYNGLSSNPWRSVIDNDLFPSYETIYTAAAAIWKSDLGANAFKMIYLTADDGSVISESILNQKNSYQQPYYGMVICGAGAYIVLTDGGQNPEVVNAVLPEGMTYLDLYSRALVWEFVNNWFGYGDGYLTIDDVGDNWNYWRILESEGFYVGLVNDLPQTDVAIDKSLQQVSGATYKDFLDAANVWVFVEEKLSYWDESGNWVKITSLEGMNEDKCQRILRAAEEDAEYDAEGLKLKEVLGFTFAELVAVAEAYEPVEKDVVLTNADLFVNIGTSTAPDYRTGRGFARGAAYPMAMYVLGEGNQPVQITEDTYTLSVEIDMDTYRSYLGYNWDAANGEGTAIDIDAAAEAAEEFKENAFDWAEDGETVVFDTTVIAHMLADCPEVTLYGKLIATNNTTGEKHEFEVFLDGGAKVWGSNGNGEAYHYFSTRESTVAIHLMPGQADVLDLNVLRDKSNNLNVTFVIKSDQTEKALAAWRNILKREDGLMMGYEFNVRSFKGTTAPSVAYSLGQFSLEKCLNDLKREVSLGYMPFEGYWGDGNRNNGTFFAWSSERDDEMILLPVDEKCSCAWLWKYGEEDVREDVFGYEVILEEGSDKIVVQKDPNVSANRIIDLTTSNSTAYSHLNDLLAFKKENGKLVYENGTVSYEYVGDIPASNYTAINAAVRQAASEDGYMSNQEGHLFLPLLRIKAPDGYVAKSYEGRFTGSGGEIGDNQDYMDLAYMWVGFGRYQTYTLTWQAKDNPQKLRVEQIIIDTPGSNDMSKWMDLFANRIPEGRITVTAMDKDSGVVNSKKDGLVWTEFIDDGHTILDIDELLDAKVTITVPDGAVAYRWIRLATDGLDDPTLNDWNMHYANMFKNNVDQMPKRYLGEQETTLTRPLQALKKQTYGNNGEIQYYYSADKNTRFTLIEWFFETGDPVYEYLQVDTSSYYCQWKEDVVTEVEGAVDAPTAIAPVLPSGNIQLVTRIHPQADKGGTHGQYFFELRLVDGEGNTFTEYHDKGYIIILPYSFMGEDWNYAKAQTLKKKPMINHYDKDFNLKQNNGQITGEYTERGIEFKVGDFSPFMLTWDESEFESNTGGYPGGYYPSVTPDVSVNIDSGSLNEAALAVGSAINNGSADITPAVGYTKADIEKLQQDSKLKMSIEKSLDCSAKDKETIDAAISKAAGTAATPAAQYFDITVVLKHEDTGATVGKVRDTKTPVSITVDLNSELQQAARAGKYLYVVRCHDGKTAFLKAELNTDKTKVTFSTSLFSAYAVVALDKEVPVEAASAAKPTTPPAQETVTPVPEDTTPVVPDEPVTDEPVVDEAPAVDTEPANSAGLWIGVGIVALAAIVVVLAVMVVRKKRK